MRERPASLLCGSFAFAILVAVTPASAQTSKAPAKSGTTTKTKAGATPAPADKTDGGALTLTPEASAARGIAFYDAGQYDQCAEQLGTLLGDATQSTELSPRTREQASVYRAACLIAQGKLKDADDVFRIVIRANPQMAVPSTIVFPQAVIERFVIVRTTLFEEIRRGEEERIKKEREAVARAKLEAEAERTRVAGLEKLAAEETVVTQNHRWLAWVPFGVGQFQNRQPVLGAVFLTSEVLLLGTAVTSAMIQLHLNSVAKGGRGFTDEAQIDQLNENLRTANTVGLYTTGGFIAVAALGVIQANLAFVPEFPLGVRPRGTRQPPRASAVIAPYATPLEGGAAAGVFGRF